MANKVLFLSSGRKGTWLTLTALRQHPQIEVQGQVVGHPTFHPEESGEQLLKRLLDRSEKDVVILPVAWVQARHNIHAGFWDSVKTRKLSVIYLHRHNMLRWYLSAEISRITKVCRIYSETQPPLPTIKIDIKKCEKDIARNLMDVDESKIFLKGFPSIDLVYEDLVHDFAGQILRIEKFLGVNSLPVKPITKKQDSRPLHEVIVNFSELRRVWKNTKWERYLEDKPDPKV